MGIMIKITTVERSVIPPARPGPIMPLFITISRSIRARSIAAGVPARPRGQLRTWVAVSREVSNAGLETGAPGAPLSRAA